MRSYIAPGIGAEGFLTDTRSGQIRDAMMPSLKTGDYNAAIDVGTRTIASLIADNLGIQDHGALEAEDAVGRGAEFHSC